MFAQSVSSLNKSRPAYFWSNFPLVFSMLLTLIFPPSLIQGSYPGSQDTSFVYSSDYQIRGGKIIQNCQLKHKCALHFNGVNQWVSLEQFSGFDTASFTLETWFNWEGAGTPIPGDNESLTDGLPLITIGGSEGSGSDTNVDLFFGIQASSGKLMAVFKEESPVSGSNTQYHSIFGNSRITQGTWHHAAVSYDGQTWNLFLNGNLDASFKFTTPIVPQLVSSRHAYLAAALSSTAEGRGFFMGKLDEVRIWEIARSQKDILSTVNLEDVVNVNLISHLSMNEGAGVLGNDLADKGIIDAINDPVWTDGAPFNVSATTDSVQEDNLSISGVANASPYPPTLISPSNGATGVSTMPTLSVAVSDPEADNLTVRFYVRASSWEGASDFTLVALPDTQKYTINGLGIFDIQTQWIVDQRSAQNFAFITHLGDMVNDWNVPSQWNIANAAMSRLEPPGIPYGISPGNRDEDHYGTPPDTTFFNTYFPASRFAGRPYYGGAYNDDNANNYQLFSASGMDFIIIHLKYNLSYYPDQASAILSWADNLLHTYSNRRAIVVTHYLLNTSNNFGPDGSLIYSELKDNPNLFLMLGGHLDTEGQRQDPGDDGHTIYSLRSDYQNRANGGNGWLRLMRFSPSVNKIFVTTYSPYLNQYETDANSQFSLDYDMSGTGFQVIGTTNVPSGSNASLDWANLLPGQQYEWYVSVDDGTSTTTGSTWSFTTGSGSTAPVITTQPANQTVNAGQTASFTAAVSGNPTPTVQWQVSTDSSTWNDIAGATSTTYSFTTQTGDNGKQFRAVFNNPAGSATTNTATLTVYAAPVITTQPVNQMVNAGQTAAFTAVASGNPTPAVQWQVSTDGSTWNDIAGATSTTYSFTVQVADNGKQFRAVFTNSAGSATSTAALLTVISDLIFADGFESGGLSAWSSATTDGGNLSASTTAALVGALGMQALINDNNSIYVTDNRPAAEQRYRARFYFDPNTIKMKSGNAYYIFYGLNAVGKTVMQVEFRQSSGQYQIRAGLLNDKSSFTSTAWFTISDAPHFIEFDWRASTAAKANNGGLTLWIDGVQKDNVTGIDNDTRRIDSARLGVVSGIDNGTRGRTYFDAFESHRQSYIGP